MSRARDIANIGDGVTAADITDATITAAKMADGAVEGAFTTQIGRRNLIINGDFSIWQRGTSFTNSSSTKYTADRWQVYGAGSSTLDITRQSFSAGQTDVEGNPRYYIRLDNTPDADSTWMELFQRVEDVTYFSNVPVTLSFWIRSNRNITNQNYFSFVQNFGSGGSSNVSTASSNFDISTSWEKKTLNVTLPSIAGKTVGAGSYLEIHLLQTSSVQADTYYDIANVQLEVGTVATPFEHRSYGEELALCQRYYQKLGGTAYQAVGFGKIYAAGQSAFAYVCFNTPMRTAPTVSEGGNGLIVTDRVAYDDTVTSVSNVAAGKGSLYGVFNTGVTRTDRHPVIIACRNGASGWLNLDAEL